MAFPSSQYGAEARWSHIQGILDVLTGVSGGGDQVQLIQYNNSSNYALDVRNLDTTNGYGLRVRDGASANLLTVAKNAIGIGATTTDILTVSATARFADGLVGTPGIAFSADTNTGLYRIGADNVGLALGGRKIVDFATGTIQVVYASDPGNGAAVDSPTLDFVGAYDSEAGAGVTITSRKYSIHTDVDTDGGYRLTFKNNSGTIIGSVNDVGTSGHPYMLTDECSLEIRGPTNGPGAFITTTNSADADGRLVGRFKAIDAIASPTPAVFVIGQMALYLQGTTANNRGGKIQFYTKADAGTLNRAVEIDNAQNVGFIKGLSVGSYGAGTGVLFIANATVAPTSNPTGGGILYVTAGALTYRGSSGTVTTIANA